MTSSYLIVFREIHDKYIHHPIKLIFLDMVIDFWLWDHIILNMMNYKQLILIFVNRFYQFVIGMTIVHYLSLELYCFFICNGFYWSNENLLTIFKISHTLTYHISNYQHDRSFAVKYPPYLEYLLIYKLHYTSGSHSHKIYIQKHYECTTGSAKIQH